MAGRLFSCDPLDRRHPEHVPGRATDFVANLFGGPVEDRPAVFQLEERLVLRTRVRQVVDLSVTRCVVSPRNESMSVVLGSGGGQRTGPSAVDRRKPGTKQTVMTDANGIPLAMTHDQASGPDVKTWEPPLEAVPPGRGQLGHPQR